MNEPIIQLPTQFKILLIGDNCTDVYQYGVVDRISPEAPVPVFQFVNEEQLYFDKAFNQIKGLVYGLVCSTIGKKTSVQIALEKSLQFKKCSNSK